MSSTGLQDRRQSATALVGWVAAGAAAVTLAVVVLPFIRFGYRAPALHVALETANALIALLVGFLVYGRYRQRRRLQDFLLVLALGTVAVANLALSALPVAVTLGSSEQFTGWAGLAIRFLGTGLLAAAALGRADRRIQYRRALMVTLALGALIVAVGAAGVAWGSHLPPLVDPAAELDDPATPQLTAHPLVLITQAVGAGLYAIAAIAFGRRSDRRRDELFRWVAAGCVLATASRVHYLLYPSLYSNYVYTGDLLRLSFYLLLLVGAAREIKSYWELRTRTAVLEDRRRMARDLHDGLAQELSFLWSQSRALSGGASDAVAVERIGGAAARALDEARRAIAALTRPLDEPFPRTLQQVAEDLGSRYDVKVVPVLDPDVEVSPEHGEALVRITAEAVRNAVRHGKAEQIDLTLTDRPLTLTVADDGEGFSARPETAIRGGGFGLTSMRERARTIGADFSITSTPGEGTTVRVIQR